MSNLKEFDIFDNIVNIVEKNPLTILSIKYNKKLLTEIQEKFTNEHEKLFINNYYRYFNYNLIKDFVINFNNLSLELGYKKRENSEKFLQDNFKINKDYIVDGDNYMLNIDCFKVFCIKSTTIKSNFICECYITLQEIINKMLLEERNEMKLNCEICHMRNNKLQLDTQDFEDKNNQLKNKLYLIEEKNNENKSIIIDYEERNEKLLSKIEVLKEKKNLFNKYQPTNVKLDILNWKLSNVIPCVIEKITDNIQSYRMII